MSPNETVALIVAKAASPATGGGQGVILLTLQFFSFPGDVSSDDYDNNLPDFRHPMAFGIVSALSAQASGEPCRFFTASYISGTTHTVSFPLSAFASCCLLTFVP